MEPWGRARDPEATYKHHAAIGGSGRNPRTSLSRWRSRVRVPSLPRSSRSARYTTMDGSRTGLRPFSVPPGYWGKRLRCKTKWCSCRHPLSIGRAHRRRLGAGAVSSITGGARSPSRSIVTGSVSSIPWASWRTQSQASRRVVDIVTSFQVVWIRLGGLRCTIRAGTFSRATGTGGSTPPGAMLRRVLRA